MSRLRTLRWIYGSLAPGVQAVIATALDEMVDEILAAAVTNWQADGWRSFDSHESNRTIQLYRWIEHAIRTTPSLRSVTPRLEWVQPTPGMYAGTESATKVPRPDIRLSVGTSGGVTLECKRLSLGSQHPVRYVHEGMDRFVSGEYAASEREGRMIGYVEADGTPTILTAVNASVSAHPSMGISHVLHEVSPGGPSHSRYHSDHIRPNVPQIRLVHHWVDLVAP